MKKIAISIGDLNGIGMQILLSCHDELVKICEPYYFVHYELFQKANKLLKINPKSKINLVEISNALKPHFAFKEEKENFLIYEFLYQANKIIDFDFELNPANLDAKSGAYSFLSFEGASYCTHLFLDALVTLPINKKTWQMAGVSYKGHTEALRDFFKQDAIMMLGCDELFVALYTEHMPLRDIYKEIKAFELAKFLINFYQCTLFEKIGVLGFNPHASDNGVIGGEEEQEIKKAIRMANVFLKDHALNLQNLENEYFLSQKEKEFSYKENIFLSEPLVADSAFTPFALSKCKYLVSMYHDLALAPLKALYFDKSINASLNLPIIRTSVDHGTAYDRAYKNEKINLQSYMQAVKSALQFLQIKEKNK
ncbi:4-hydroxythreonine-4-phosphate dehydrogenase [Campylobacter lari]|uniref:4-hydroxythreonine-4-phosphate dehydrogenase n=1 Tax=Campylobacter lari TaxID=201 RepID=A0A5L4NNE9_CAMLA|nr:4-hydroxythreonine-4-phosphate dehydrogenase [Campylobacter lari]EAI3914025.1 4-hydroxythreonine-4-phosphate dehydrogenase [Campylobacter lari]EAJ6187350.1 4-hydroxythreonine-4-phosphate dehydrogenase [Campylobacter lari]EAK0828231.1 4-hydroxythreonine-4-phosphate dehydrogenase [Campylobacter lari]